MNWAIVVNCTSSTCLAIGKQILYTTFIVFPLYLIMCLFCFVFQAPVLAVLTNQFESESYLAFGKPSATYAYVPDGY